MAGARGTTLGDAATDEVSGALGGALGEDAPKTGGGGAAELPCRSGGGGGTERRAPGETPRAEGGGGIRELSALPPAGRGTTLTGLSATLLGDETEGTPSGALEALGSFSSPIERLSGLCPASRTLTRRAGYSRTIS